MSRNLRHQHLEGPSYRIQPPTSFDSRPIILQGSNSEARPLARRVVRLPRDRCYSFLLIFSFYLLLSTCLAMGLSYTDKRVYFTYFFPWLMLHNVGFANISDGPVASPGTTPVWVGLKGGEHCLRYATREYTARLSTSAIGQEAMRACKETPAEIHGQLLETEFCRDLGLGRGVWGYWVVDFDEPACQTKWGKFVDLGCVNNRLDSKGTSFRHVEAHLDNLQTGADWRIMCTTTPADINGQHFFTPAECFNLGKLGIFGSWDVQDTSCETSNEGSTVEI